MQARNQVRKQAGKIGVLLTAFLVSIARAQQAHTTGISIAHDIAPDAPARQIIVSIPDRKLALVENGEVKKTFPVAVGKASTPSPAGSFHIVSRVTNPTYYHEGKIVPPGPANPVGTRWMGLSEHGYGIHGTNAPNSIGKAASHGCIRMARADLEQLFAMVRVDDAVEIRAERDEQTAAIFNSEKTGSVKPAAITVAAVKMAAADNTVLADASLGAKNVAR
jgi:lipoprotein-anchoring transpeptidase ErfK/SrfK